MRAQLSSATTQAWTVNKIYHLIAAMYGIGTNLCVSLILVVLGVLPFVREFLRRKTKVILCANSEPSLNDVTYPELLEIVDGASRNCPIIRASLSSQNLIVAQSGQKGLYLFY